MTPVHAMSASDRTSISAPLASGPADFIGLWTVRRRLVDHLGHAHLRFAGQARIEADAITETGELRSDHGTTEARRLYRLSMDADGVDVLFPNGSEFVRLGLSASQSVRHHCGDDLYEGRFVFRSRDCWIEFWRVSGPRKRYASLTRYERIPATG